MMSKAQINLIQRTIDLLSLPDEKRPDAGCLDIHVTDALRCLGRLPKGAGALPFTQCMNTAMMAFGEKLISLNLTLGAGWKALMTHKERRHFTEGYGATIPLALCITGLNQALNIAKTRSKEIKA